MLGRFRELYATGGWTEVLRGVDDFFLYNVEKGRLRTALYSTQTLELAGLEIQFSIETLEDIKRARGHGERETLTAFANAIGPDDIIWDVGANVGTYSILGALAGGRVEAFEPGSDALGRLEKNAALNDVSVEVHEYALSDHNGESVLSAETHSGHRQLTADGSGDVVQVRRGDDIDAPEPDIVKIDVEGAEMDVVRGMPETLTTTRACFVEVHDGVSTATLEDELEQCGLTRQTSFDTGQRENPILQFG